MKLKIGIIGIGDIAKKAYLPILGAKEGVELVLCTRNTETQKQMKDKYKHLTCVSTLEELLLHQIDGAFIHAATSAHYDMVKTLLEHGIPVHVDKPVCDNLKEVETLFQLAKQVNTPLFVGFNRRYSKWVADLSTEAPAHLVIHQKNRSTLPGPVREFIFDDFIHVVDTLRHLLREPITDLSVNGLIKEGLLYSVNIQLTTKSAVGIGIMNRYSGKNEERIEYMCPDKKIIIDDLNDCTIYQNQSQIKPSPSGWDWVPLLTRRGFEPMIDDFLAAVKTKKGYDASAEGNLMTHQLCEEIVAALLKN